MQNGRRASASGREISSQASCGEKPRARGNKHRKGRRTQEIWEGLRQKGVPLDHLVQSAAR
eukprot:2053591-Pyramimonas_sp.AAC.1